MAIGLSGAQQRDGGDQDDPIRGCGSTQLLCELIAQDGELWRCGIVGDHHGYFAPAFVRGSNDNCIVKTGKASHSGFH